MNDHDLSRKPEVLEAIHEETKELDFIMASEPRAGALLALPWRPRSRAGAFWNSGPGPASALRGFLPGWTPTLASTPWTSTPAP